MNKATNNFMVCWLLITDRIVIEIMFFNAKLRNAVWTFSPVQTSHSFQLGIGKQESKVGVLFFLTINFEICKSKQKKERLIVFNGFEGSVIS